MARNRAYGVYYIFKSMEQGPTFRVSVPKYPTQDPYHRILAPQRSRFTHYYFYIRDETLGPMVMRVASFFPFRTTYYLNGHSFIEQELNRARIAFRKTDNAFLAVFQHAFLKQYEKFATFLRNELVSNNLADFRLKKGLDHLDAVRERFHTITGRFAGFQAQWLNVHVDFPLLQRLGLPITIGAVRYPGIKIHDPRVIRLLEVLLHGGSQVGGWTAKQIHHAVFTTFHLSDSTYGLNQLRYDLRKLKAHGLLQRDGSCYVYRLTPKGVQVALLFLFFHKRLCGPLANSRFHHCPDTHHKPASKLEAAYHRADKAIQQIVDLLAASPLRDNC